MTTGAKRRGGWLLMVIVSPLGCSNVDSRSRVAREMEVREAVGRAAAVDAGAGRSLLVASREDVRFEAGFSVVEYDPPDDFRNHAFRWMGQRGSVRLRGHRSAAMRLTVNGWLNEKVIRSKGVITSYLNGWRLATTGAVENGHWFIATTVPVELTQKSEWLDLTMEVSAVAYHWSDVPALRVVVVTKLLWEEDRETEAH